MCVDVVIDCIEFVVIVVIGGVEVVVDGVGL